MASMRPTAPGDSRVAVAKGSIFLDVRSFVKARFGEAGWERVLGALPPETAVMMRSVVPVGWYATTAQVELINAVARELGGGELTVVDDLAFFAAEEDLHGIYRAFLRLASPAFVLERGMQFWSRFQNTGRWEISRTSETEATATLVGFRVRDAVLCRYLQGYMTRMMTLAGARDLRVEHVLCRARGDAACTFKGRWSA